jgi:hypothetical protein
LTSEYNYDISTKTVTLTRNGSALSYGVVNDPTGNYYLYVEVSNQTLASSYVYAVEITTKSVAPGSGSTGGGGGGTQPKSECGNGYCEKNEDEFNCPADCKPSAELMNYSFETSTPFISRFVAENKTFEETISVLNTNPVSFTVVIEVKCVNNSGIIDKSCDWTNILVDNNSYKEYHLVLPIGSEREPSRTPILVRMVTPSNISMINYRTNIVFTSAGISRIVPFELKSLAVTGWIGWAIDSSIDFWNMILLKWDKYVPILGNVIRGQHLIMTIVAIIVIAVIIKFGRNIVRKFQGKKKNKEGV